MLVIMTSVQMMAQFGGTYLQKQIIDNVIIDGQTDLIVRTIIGMSGCFLLSVILMFVNPYISLINYSRIRLRMSTWLFKYLKAVPLVRFQQERTNDLTGLFLWQLHLIPFACSDRLWVFIQHFMMSLALAGFLFWVNPYMMLVCFITSLCYVWLGWHYGKKLKALTKSVWDRRYKVGICLEEGISATREMVAYDLEDWDAGRYEKQFNDYYEKVMEETDVRNARLWTSNSIEWAVRLFLFLCGAAMVYNDQMSIGVFVVAYIFGSQFLTTIQALFESGTDIMGQLGHVEKLRQVTSDEVKTPGLNQLAGNIQSIVVDEVSFRYPDNDRDVLASVDCSLPIGKTIAIVGASGSGKSTLAGLLFGLHEPKEGTIRVNGKPLQQWDLDEWSARAVIVVQEPYLFNDSIRANLLLGQNKDENEIRRICGIVQLQSFLDTLPDGLDTVIGERGVTISGGQRQRLAIARALLRNPQILILDEATSALDLETERRLQASLQQERAGKTTIIVAHRLTTVYQADLILVMDNGKLVEQGVHDELIRNHSCYRRLLESDQESGGLRQAVDI